MEQELKIHTLGNQGQGVARDESGTTYYVSGAFPGDRVTVEAPEAGRHREAVLLNVVAPSEDRVESPCAYSSTCGGCDWMGLSYPAQVQAKDRLLTHTLERFGFTPEVRHPFIPATRDLGYRTRIQLRSEGGKIGFLKRGSHELVAIDRCAVADERLNQKIAELKAAGLPDERQKIELGVSDFGEVWSAVNKPHAAMGFTQVNPEANEVLKKCVVQAVKQTQAQRVLELFSGDGNLSFACASLAKKWQGVEVDAASVGRANQRAVEMGLSASQMRFSRADLFSMGAAARWVGTEPGDRYDTLILDPPRSGMGKTLTHFAHSNLRNVVYISCSLQSFITDVVPLKEEFALEELWAIDMFPHTRHFEIVARFSRR